MPSPHSASDNDFPTPSTLSPEGHQLVPVISGIKLSDTGNLWLSGEVVTFVGELLLLPRSGETVKGSLVAEANGEHALTGDGVHGGWTVAEKAV